MTIKYRQFVNNLLQNPHCLLEFYLPDSTQVAAHFHITDVGSVFRYFIDCGGKTRDEAYVQIQLWLGKDSDHRLNAGAMLKILKQSQAVLNKLSDLATRDVLIEYKQTLTSQYPIADIKTTAKAIKVYLAPLTTECLAAIRHEQEKAGDDCCAQSCC